MDAQYIILIIIVLILVTITFISSCYKFCHRKKNVAVVKPIQYVSIIIMLSFISSYLFWLISIFDDHKIFDAIEYFSFAMGWFALYIFMFYRLYHTFQDSTYKMSKVHIYFHIIVAFFIPVWYCIMYGAKIYQEINSYLILSAIGSILTLVGLLLLIITFNRNLFNAILLQEIVINRNSNLGNIESSPDYDALSGDSSEYEYYQDERPKGDIDNLLTVITKQTLLGSIMTMGMILFVILIIILIMSKSDRDDTEWIIYEWFLGIVVIVNCLCIFFGFKMNEKAYKIFFKSCHNRLLWSYKKLAINTQNKQNNNVLSSNLAAHADLTNDTDYFIHR